MNRSPEESDVRFAKHFREEAQQWRWKRGLGAGELPSGDEHVAWTRAMLLTIFEEVKDIRRELQSDLSGRERVGDSLKRTFERVVSGDDYGPTRLKASDGERVRDSEENLKEEQC